MFSVRGEGVPPDLRSSKLAAECDFLACQRDDPTGSSQSRECHDEYPTESSQSRGCHDEYPTESYQSRGCQITHGAENVSLIHQSLQPLFFPRDVQSICCLSLCTIQQTRGFHMSLPPLTLFQLVQARGHCLKGPGSILYS